MNNLNIIGNLTANPELRTTASGKEVCTFTVAVNRRDKETDFFRVSAWEGLGKTCNQYLSKGRKVWVMGPVSARTFTAKDGTARASLEVTAKDVEFLSPKSETTDKQSGLEVVQPTMDDFPWN